MADHEQYPTSREIIYLLGMGTLLLGSILMPGLGLAAYKINKIKRNYNYKQNQKIWKKFNIKYLGLT